MDTPTIAEYYREADPRKRKALLEQALASGEDMEANEIRREIWEARYKDDGTNVADGYLKFWMSMEFNKNAGNRLFGVKSAQKEIRKELNSVKYPEFLNKSELHKELLYRECCHLIKLYMDLCKTDRSYNTMLCGIITIKEEDAKAKLQKDIYKTAVCLPKDLGMEKELDLLTRAAREMYELHFPGEGGLPE
ncbi:DUF6553 family protein [Blautia sp. XA-2221]|uniref:DUF6553 family protein n=1 Tax=Blautia sp. XA-2221 TaxID=2903961 RepID=UPI002379A176|nr:DUF6553 family protein [Blautia sp. XA-2221]